MNVLLATQGLQRVLQRQDSHFRQHVGFRRHLFNFGGYEAEEEALPEAKKSARRAV